MCLLCLTRLHCICIFSIIALSGLYCAIFYVVRVSCSLAVTKNSRARNLQSFAPCIIVVIVPKRMAVERVYSGVSRGE